ncbi:hypothetical protein HYW87_03695, partial [Candidatus Roizmanbacteria bacterium]|nr:hypothetical protein [Candidatus Roizmanbacteria bacterium]
MSNIEPQSIALTVITYYPKWYLGKLRSIKHTDKVRGDLTLKFLIKATKLRYQIVVADGKSSKTFRNIILHIPRLVIIKRKSLKRSVAKRQVIKKASTLANVKIIIITEPEKVSLLDSLDKITKSILEGRADVVIPRRNIVLFQKSYPSYMHESEIEGNKLYNEVLRTNKILKKKDDLDMFFGPCAFANTQRVVSLFTRPYHLKISKSAYLDSYFYSDPISVPIDFGIVMSLKKRFRVKSVDIP